MRKYGIAVGVEGDFGEVAVLRCDASSFGDVSGAVDAAGGVSVNGLVDDLAWC